MNTDLAKQVKDDIVAQIKNDELVLPTLPEIALKVREVAENPNATIDELCDVISRDPALSARIIKVTNSPLLRTSMPVDDLVAAVSRLGIDFTSNLAIGLAMEQMFQATRPCDPSARGFLSSGWPQQSLNRTDRPHRY